MEITYISSLSFFRSLSLFFFLFSQFFFVRGGRGELGALEGVMSVQTFDSRDISCD